MFHLKSSQMGLNLIRPTLKWKIWLYLTPLVTNCHFCKIILFLGVRKSLNRFILHDMEILSGFLISHVINLRGSCFTWNKSHQKISHFVNCWCSKMCNGLIFEVQFYTFRAIFWEVEVKVWIFMIIVLKN